VSIPAATGRSGRAGVVVALSVALLQVACSTTYQPRHTGRVGMVIHHGAAVYVKDGRELPLGPFSGDLEGLVADVPAAAAHAHTAHTQFAGVVVGIVVLSGPIGWVVIGVGAATAGTGLGFMGTGLTHAVDAVNIHNDAASDLRPAP
jgi:hypothetical protein